jgi:hypothetical protein
MSFATQIALASPQAKLTSPATPAPPERPRDPIGNQVALHQLSRSPPRLQPKLEIGAVDDPLEREADAVADKVMRMPDPALTLSLTPPRVSRKCAACEGEDREKLRRKPAVATPAAPSASSAFRPTPSGRSAESAPPLVDRALRGSSSLLNGDVRSFMEARFGADFSHVRVHTGPTAAASARAIGAKAYTFRDSIVFGQAAYSPATHDGRHLLAHELAHVVQQGATASADAALIRRAPDLTDNDAKTCSPLYKQKLCVSERGACIKERDAGADVSADLMVTYNKDCREESGYEGDDISLSEAECQQLRTPACPRGTKDEVLAARMAARNKRISDAMGRAGKYVLGGAGAELLQLAQDPFFVTGLEVSIGLYLALWFVPEPVISKIAAATVTIAILSAGAFTVSLIKKLADAWQALDNEAGGAQTDPQIEAAGKHFGESMGGAGADLLVFIAQLYGATKLPLPKGAPPAAEALQSAAKALEGVTPGTQIRPGAKIIPFPETQSAPGPVAFDGRAALKIEIAPAAEPAFTPEPVPLPRGVPANDLAPAPTPGTGAAPTPKAVPVPAVASNKPKPKCSPAGLTEDDAISFVWFKPKVDDFYPRTIVVAGATLGRDGPPTKLPTGEPIGVDYRYWPTTKKKPLQLLPSDRGDNADRFRAVLQRNGFKWDGLQADHVQDLEFGGPDDFSNLWPLDSSANMSAGARTQSQPLTLCAGPNDPAPVTTSFADAKKNIPQFYGRYFRITSITR